MNYAKIIDDVIEQYRQSPVDMLDIKDGDGEFIYLNNLKSSYIRTITDIDRFLTGDRTQKNILEVGSFLGAVSISLKKLGFNMFAIDIPEFHQSERLRALYDKHDIDIHNAAYLPDAVDRYLGVAFLWPISLQSPPGLFFR